MKKIISITWVFLLLGMFQSCNQENNESLTERNLKSEGLLDGWFPALGIYENREPELELEDSSNSNSNLPTITGVGAMTFNARTSDYRFNIMASRATNTNTYNAINIPVRYRATIVYQGGGRVSLEDLTANVPIYQGSREGFQTVTTVIKNRIIKSFRPYLTRVDNNGIARPIESITVAILPSIRYVLIEDSMITSYLGNVDDNYFRKLKEKYHSDLCNTIELKPKSFVITPEERYFAFNYKYNPRYYASSMKAEFVLSIHYSAGKGYAFQRTYLVNKVVKRPAKGIYSGTELVNFKDKYPSSLKLNGKTYKPNGYSVISLHQPSIILKNETLYTSSNY